VINFAFDAVNWFDADGWATACKVLRLQFHKFTFGDQPNWE